MIEATFAIFAVLSLLVFRFVEPGRAVATTCFAGWLLLPVGNFPEGAAEAEFAYWITGAAVPSDMLLTKMWWPPAVALAGALWRDHETLLRWRPRWIDAPIFLWCLWPILQWPLVVDPAPQPWVSSLYLAGAWGTPWLLGRIYFSGNRGGVRLIRTIIAGLVAIVPIGLMEGVFGPALYELFYDPHPFVSDGAERALGFRPLGFFENGNQYGIWVAASAMAAIWLWQADFDPRLRTPRFAIAAIALLLALVSQSVGAILLLVAGLWLLWAIARPAARWMVLAIFVLLAGGAAVYLSGVLPLRAIADKTVIGKQVVEFVRSTGRRSFTWRIARDQQALVEIAKHPVAGSGRWDWWRNGNERPWSLVFLVFGQFGLTGLALAFGALLLPVFRTAFIRWKPGGWQRNRPDAALAILILMAVGDAMLNSFFFYPAILAAGAMASAGARIEYRQPRVPASA